MDESQIKCPTDIVVDIGSNVAFISGQLKENTNAAYVGDWAIIITDPIIRADFTHFKDYIMRNRFYYSFDYANHFLYDLILKLETE